MKDWGESECELIIVKKNNYKKLYTVLSCFGVFTFCTCCKILICLMCFFASFKLSFVYCCWLTVCIVVVVLCVIILCVYAVLCVHCCFYFRCRTAG